MQGQRLKVSVEAESAHHWLAQSPSNAVPLLPDLKMLKLGSPELERMIIQQNGMVTTTPTPSAALPYFLKSEPTEEQEQYARGFVDALNQLHQSNGHPNGGHTLGQKCPQPDPNNNHSNHSNHHSHSQSNSHLNHQNLMSSDSSSDLTIAEQTSRRNSFHNPVTQPKFAVPTIPSTVPTTTTCAPEHYVSVSSCQTNGAHVLINNSRTTALPPYSQAVTTNCKSVEPFDQCQTRLSRCLPRTAVNPMPNIKVEPTQQVMRLSPPMVGPLSPSQAQTSLTRPIDMAEQERVKLERKRLRNRIAASKCRRRKLERISKLEDKVKLLKGENSELSVVVNKLRDQVPIGSRVLGLAFCEINLFSISNMDFVAIAGVFAEAADNGPCQVRLSADGPPMTPQ